jgi:hypothetical protein
MRVVTPIIESEEHVLTECPAYHHIRINLSENLLSLLLKEYGTIMLSHHLPEFGKYITDCHHRRNPKKNDQEKDIPHQSTNKDL